MIEPCYRGRFAPSPTGPLHFGSILAALASWLDARHHGGQWLVRMEDLDLPRQEPGADERILRTLEECGLTWDEDVVWQSRRTGLYQSALDRLKQQDVVFACACTRREVASEVYPGTCRNGVGDGREARAWRVRVAPETVGFIDRLQGHFEQHLETEAGDFMVLRADGLFAYQLAVVVDDADQGITDVVRGADLLDSTPRQIWLQQLLSLPSLQYLHVPVAANAAGEKVSKQKRAPQAGPEALLPALEFLGHPAPKELDGATPRELLAWAVEAWNPARIPPVRALREPSPVP